MKAPLAGIRVLDLSRYISRHSLRVAGNGHQPTHRLHRRVKAGLVPVGAIRSEAGDAHHNKPRVMLFELLIAQAHPLYCPSLKVFNENIGFARQVKKRLLTCFAAKVQRDSPLAAVHGKGIQALAAVKRRQFMQSSSLAKTFFISMPSLFAGMLNTEYFKFFITKTDTTKHKSVTTKRVNRVDTHTAHNFFNFVIPSVY